MHGQGTLRKCICGGDDPACSQHLELRGPRNITSSNIDRCFDDGGKRFLFIEHKHENEAIPGGQSFMLKALARLPQMTVWITKGSPDRLVIYEIGTGAAPVVGDWSTLQAKADAWFDGM